jgi:mono/diheme cytochrome c family protein
VNKLCGSLVSGVALVLGSCSAQAPLSDQRATASHDPRLVARGAQLSAVGNCHGCHTRQGGAAYAGGVPLTSAFGTIYSTNITPDRETGIGTWSREAFARAMREGVRKDGAHLYPAFPYDRFTRTSDEDIDALYAWFMSIPAVRYEPPANRLVFPMNVRTAIGVWKARHFKPEDRLSPGRGSDLLARGEYLVEGLGHCGSCHSPRTPLQAEDKNRLYDGGEAEGWHAYAINEKNAAPIPWDVPALAHYLRHGWHPQHGIARGTMGLVTHELSAAAPEDIEAMAVYTMSLMKAPTPARVGRGRELVRDPKIDVPPGTTEPGARIYDSACHGCHRGTEDMPWDGMPLSWSIGLTGESPRNVINVILHGIPAAPNGETTPVMPGYAGALDDRQVEALVTWMRARLTDRPPWPNVAGHIAKARKMTPEMLMFAPGGTGFDPTRAATLSPVLPQGGGRPQ